MVFSYDSRFDLAMATFNGNITFCSPAGAQKTLNMDCSALNTRMMNISLRCFFRENADPAVHLFLEDKPVMNGAVESNDPLNIGCASKVNLTDGGEHIISLALDDEIWLMGIRRLSTNKSALAYNEVALPVLDEENKKSPRVSLGGIVVNTERPITKVSKYCTFDGNFMFTESQRKFLVKFVKKETGLTFSLDVSYANRVISEYREIKDPFFHFKINQVECKLFGSEDSIAGFLGSTKVEFDGISQSLIMVQEQDKNSENQYKIVWPSGEKRPSLLMP